MQVERYDLRDLKRETRGRSPVRCAEMALGQRVGTVTTFGDAFLAQGPPVSSGLVHWWRADTVSLSGAPSNGTYSTAQATDAVSSPSYISTEAPRTGAGRSITANTAGAAQHGVARGFVSSPAAGAYTTIRAWVRQAPTGPTTQWCYLESNGGGMRAWFDLVNGVFGTINNGGTGVVEARFTSPTDGFVWYLLAVKDYVHSGGAGGTGLYMATADNSTAFVQAGEVIHYDTIELYQDKVTTWSNKKTPADTLDQGTYTAEPGWIAASANLQGNPSLRFYDAHSIAHSTAATWQFLHDGSGASWALVWRTLDTTTVGAKNVFTTNGNSTTATGVSLTYDHSLGRMAYDIGGAGSNKIHFQWAFDPSAHWIGSSCASVDTPDVSWWFDGVLNSSGNPSGSFTAAAPGSPLTLGGASSFTGEIPELHIWNRSLTSADWALVHSYFKARYGTA